MTPVTFVPAPVATFPPIVVCAATPEPDKNIDHRRCLNQMRFLSRHGPKRTTEVSATTRHQWQPGDLDYWRQPGNRQHVGVLSDRTNAESVRS